MGKLNQPRCKNKVAAWVLLSLYASGGIVSPIAVASEALNNGAHLIPYSVVAGDTLFGIGQRHGVSVDTLIELNRRAPSPLRSDVIRVGQVIYVPSARSQVLPQLADGVTGSGEAHSEAESFLASQATRIGQTYGQNDASGLQRDELKDYDTRYGANKTSEGRSLSVVEQEANYLKQQMQSAFESEANEQAKAWLGGLGTAEVSLSFDDELRLKGYSADVLAPIVDTPERMLFVQVGGRHDDSSDRTIVNVGVGQRHFAESWMFGYNAFFDHDVTRNHNRLGLGAEAWADYLKLSANFYTPLSDWKDSADFDEYLERAARGLDLNAKYYLPQYPQLGLSAKFEQYFGDEVDLLGSKDLERDPYAGTLGLEWQPVPLLKVGVEHRQAKGSQSDTQFNVGLEWKIGASLDDMLNPANVALSRQLQGMRHDLVERNNNIVLEYKEKERSVSIAHAPINEQSGHVETLAPSVSISSGRIVSWKWTSPDLPPESLSDSFIEKPTLTLPDLPLDISKQEYELYLTVTDERGRGYQSAAIPVTVNTDETSLVRTLSIVEGGTVVADSNSQNYDVSVDGNGEAEFEFVLTRHNKADDSKYVFVESNKVKGYELDGNNNYSVDIVPGDSRVVRQSGAPAKHKVKITPTAPGAPLPAGAILRFEAADLGGDWGYGFINITIKSATATPAGAPTVRDLRMKGKLEVGENLTATYAFNANGGEPTDASTFGWANKGGSLAAAQAGTDAVTTSGQVPVYTLVPADVGEVMEVSVQAKNGADVTGNTVTTDAKGNTSSTDGEPGSGGNTDVEGGDGNGGVVPSTPTNFAVTIDVTSTAIVTLNGVDSATGRPVLAQDKMTAMCAVEAAAAAVCDDSLYNIQWFVGETEVDVHPVANANGATFTATDKAHQGKRVLVEVTPK